ncbi:universal stress protein [Streptacidiphilus sp. PB12-B1b]|uniref:universal stress protein n=1 Tax=Streptacidiphilus sp. PB12-B1b TaxID=2705012 RepID=UPI0015FBA192|nr:universal stress protein [Streptacidiphilus sp. PB12-B1b]QMU77492.1 universal stress protein [Streptacidiphilus sp. PB12-B1b]
MLVDPVGQLGGAVMNGGRVVVGVTTSTSSAAALRRGQQEAWRSGRTLVVVHAWEPPEGEIVHARMPSAPMAALWQRQARRRLAGVLAEVLGADALGVEVFGVDVLDVSGLRIEPQVVRGPAWHVLPQLAAEPEDLLVLGGGGHGRITGLLRGTVRRRVLARAVCPVLTVAPPSAPWAARRALRRSEPGDFVLS